jgi:endo-alpha-1,4-polygalactosaminidase (GH114 family)
MKDIIRMNQLAGLITENQARKMMAVLNEKEQVDELFGLGSKIEIPSRENKSKLVKVGTGDLVVYNPEYDNSGYARDNEGVYTIEKIKGDHVLLKKAARDYQTNQGASSRDISGMFVKPSSLAYYGKK